MMKNYLTYTMMNAFGVDAPLCSLAFLHIFRTQNFDGGVDLVMRQDMTLHIIPQGEQRKVALPVNILRDCEGDFTVFQQAAGGIGQIMADDMHLTDSVGGAHGLHTGRYAVVCHVDAANRQSAFECIPHLLVAEAVIVVGFNDLYIGSGETAFMQSFTKSLKPQTVGIKFRIADCNQQSILRTQIFRHQFTGYTTAADEILPDEIQPVAARQIGVHRDEHNAFNVRPSVENTVHGAA